MFGKGMSDMLAQLAQRILGMTPEQVRQKIEETGTLVKNTLAHFDERLKAIERQQQITNGYLGVLIYGEQKEKPAGYGAATGGLVGCPDFRGPGSGELAGLGTSGPTGNGSGADQSGDASGAPARVIQ